MDGSVACRPSWRRFLGVGPKRALIPLGDRVRAIFRKSSPITLTAAQISDEPSRDLRLNRMPGAFKLVITGKVRLVIAGKLSFDLWQIHANDDAVLHDLATCNDHVSYYVAVASAEEQGDRIAVHGIVVVESTVIENGEIGRSPRLECTIPGSTDCGTPIPHRHGKEFRRRPIGLEALTPMGQLHEPHLAQDVVVLVQRQAVDTDANRTTATMGAADRGNAGAKVEIGAEVGDNA